MPIVHRVPLTSVATAADCPPADAGLGAVTTLTPCGGGQLAEPSYAWRTSSCWMVTSERPRVATPRKKRPKYFPSRSSTVSHRVTAKLAQPASTARVKKLASAPIHTLTRPHAHTPVRIVCSPLRVWESGSMGVWESFGGT